MMRVGSSGQLIENVKYSPAADMGPRLPIATVDAVVIHYTAGASQESDVAHLTRKDDVYVSAHFVIGRRGEVIQCVPLDRVAYHAGQSEWEGRKNLNAWSWSIELSNWGPLKCIYEKYYAWPGNWSTIVPGINVICARHRNAACTHAYWESYTIHQLIRCWKLLDALRSYAGRRLLLLGHDDVAPDRKIDPGPAFPISFFRAEGGFDYKKGES